MQPVWRAPPRRTVQSVLRPSRRVRPQESLLNRELPLWLTAASPAKHVELMQARRKEWLMIRYIIIRYNSRYNSKIYDKSG